GVFGWAVAVLPERSPARATVPAASTNVSGDLGRPRFVTMSQGPLNRLGAVGPAPGASGMRLLGLLFTCLSSFRGGRYAMSGHDGRPVTEGFPLRDRKMSGFRLLGDPERWRRDEGEPETARIDDISLRRPDRIQPQCRRSAQCCRS